MTSSDSGASELGDLLTSEVVLQLVKDHPESTTKTLAGYYAGTKFPDQIPAAVFNLVRSRIASMKRNKVPGLVQLENNGWVYIPETEKLVESTEAVKLPDMTPLTSPIRPKPSGPVADKISYAPGAGGVSVTYQGDISIAPYYERNDLWSSVSISVPIVLSSGLLWVGDKSEPNGNWTPVSLRKNARVCICNVEPDYLAYFYHQRYVKVVEQGDNGVHHCTIYKLTGDFNLYVER